MATTEVSNRASVNSVTAIQYNAIYHLCMCSVEAQFTNCLMVEEKNN